jgi:hypothetical protein
MLLAACAAGTGPTGSARQLGVVFIPDAQGLAVAGSGQRVDFGRAPAGVVPVMSRELGEGRAMGLAACPSGISQQIAWNELVLTFTAERFSGWRNATGSAGQVCA